MDFFLTHAEWRAVLTGIQPSLFIKLCQRISDSSVANAMRKIHATISVK